MEAKPECSVFFFTLLIFFCIWPPLAYGLLSSQGVNFEVVALMTIKNSLEDPHGVLDNWDETAVDPCSWNMVTCSNDGFVVSLGTPSQNLSGTLSSSIGNLTNLQSLLLQENNITGHVPSELGKLSKLKTLDLSSNFFTGSIPKEISDLRSLQYLRLNNNSLVGEIPPSLADMSQLVLLDMSYNNLSGPLPSIRAQTIKLVGNPLTCPTQQTKNCTITTSMPVALNNSQTTYQSMRSRRHNIALALGTTITCICFLVIGFSLFLWWKQKHNKQIFFDVNEQNFEEICFGTLKRFQYRELQTATSNFSSKNLIGKGGSGNVYKGCLQDGSVVAVKRLRDSTAMGGDFQFLTEVEMIGLAAHRNILRLKGFCMTSTERILVYPYMANGSAASRLRAKPTLDWSARKRIAQGAAKGLRYLHEQCDPKIIHRDVKAANILLDEELNPVVGDFGLAKLLDHNDTHVTTAVRGTAGHIAPEYLSTGQSSERTDVFGFGILLLELISGQRVLEFGKGANQRGAMLDWVKKIQHDKEIDQLVDKELNDSYYRVEVAEMVRVAMLCTQNLPNQRPNMSEVVEMLEGDRLVEKWEAINDRSETTTTSRCRSSGADEFSSMDLYSDLTDDSSLLVEAMELSGPR